MSKYKDITWCIYRIFFPNIIHSVTCWYSLILYYMIIVPPREWYKTILIQLQFEFVFIFILVVEKNGKSCVYSSSWISWDGMLLCTFFFLSTFIERLNVKFQTISRMKKQLVLIYLFWWLLSLIEWDALESCKLIWCYIERMNDERKMSLVVSTEYSRRLFARKLLFIWQIRIGMIEHMGKIMSSYGIWHLL